MSEANLTLLPHTPCSLCCSANLRLPAPCGLITHPRQNSTPSETPRLSLACCGALLWCQGTPGFRALQDPGACNASSQRIYAGCVCALLSSKGRTWFEFKLIVAGELISRSDMYFVLYFQCHQELQLKRLVVLKAHPRK